MIGKALEFVLARRPEQSAQLLDLYSKDADFRILCEDYLTIAQKIEQFRLDVLRDEEYNREFAQILQDLEAEINHLLERQENDKNKKIQ